MQTLPQRRKRAKKNFSSCFASLHLCVSILLVLPTAGSTYAFQTEPGFGEAEKLRSEQREDANIKAIEKYREAATAFQNNGDLKRATIALRNAGEILQLLGNSSEALAAYRGALVVASHDLDFLHRIGTQRWWSTDDVRPADA